MALPQYEDQRENRQDRRGDQKLRNSHQSQTGHHGFHDPRHHAQEHHAGQSGRRVTKAEARETILKGRPDHTPPMPKYEGEVDEAKLADLLAFVRAK